MVWIDEVLQFTLRLDLGGLPDGNAKPNSEDDHNRPSEGVDIVAPLALKEGLDRLVQVEVLPPGLLSFITFHVLLLSWLSIDSGSWWLLLLTRVVEVHLLLRDGGSDLTAAVAFVEHLELVKDGS